MGIYFRRSKSLGKSTRVNLTKTGASVSKKAGPLSINSRGRVTFRLGKGLSFRKKLF